MKGLAESIDRMVALEFRGDGVVDGVNDPLYRAARSKVGLPVVWEAASRLIAALDTERAVYLTTGHVLHDALLVGETDGPPGAAALARAIVLASQCPVVLFCEEAVINTLTRTCQAIGLVVRNRVDLPLPRSVAVEAFPIDPEAAAEKAGSLARDVAAMVAIEKIGRAADGNYYTGHGNDVSDTLSKVDLLFDAVRAQGGLTIGIGDLGNEIGFAGINEAMWDLVPNGQRLASSVAADFTIVGGCSNWGAYGLTAAMAGIHRNLDLMHNAELEREMIFECCRAGGVDGFSTGPTYEVDGANWRTHAAFVQLLRDVVEISIRTVKPERYRFARK